MAPSRIQQGHLQADCGELLKKEGCDVQRTGRHSLSGRHREKTFTEDTIFEISFGAQNSTGRGWRQRSQAEGKPGISRGTQERKQWPDLEC